jgi:hypothetical protein
LIVTPAPFNPLVRLSRILEQVGVPYAIIGGHAVNALKLIANRPKDQADLHGLVALPGLDWQYIRRWATEWEVLDELERLRKR